MGWQPIETAPKDGTPVDLWIVGPDDTVDFYAVTATKVEGKPLRHGRAPAWRWVQQRAPNAAAWVCVSGMAEDMRRIAEEEAAENVRNG